MGRGMFYLTWGMVTQVFFFGGGVGVVCLTHHTARGISVPRPGIELWPWHWKPRVLTTRPPGNSHTDLFMLWKFIELYAWICILFRMHIVIFQYKHLLKNIEPQLALLRSRKAIWLSMTGSLHVFPTFTYWELVDYTMGWSHELRIAFFIDKVGLGLWCVWFKSLCSQPLSRTTFYYDYIVSSRPIYAKHLWFCVFSFPILFYDTEG